MKRLILLCAAFLFTAGCLSQNKMALIEMTTSVNCLECPVGNLIIDSLAWEHPEKVIVLRYQAPLYGADPILYQDSAEINARLRFMFGSGGNAGFPGCYLNGDNTFINPRDVSMHMIDSINSQRSHFTIQVTHQLASDFDSVEATIAITSDTILQFQEGKLKMTLIMMEDSIQMASPPGNNGEKEFFFECRKFLSRVEGDTVPYSWNAGQCYTRTIKIPLPDYIYNLNNIYFIGLVQNLSLPKRDIVQAARSNQNKVPSYAGIDKLKSLDFPPVTCNPVLTGVKAYVTNLGISPLTSFQLLYRINQNQPDTIKWSGHLPPDSSKVIILPDLNIGTDGKHQIQVKVIRPNSIHIVDSWATQFSNTIESNQKADIPPVNAHFTDSHFPYHGWCVVNHSRDQNTWHWNSINSEPGKYAIKSLMLRTFSIFAGNVNEFFLPELDVSKLTSMALSFRIAHARGVEDDTLLIYLTTDCGSSWNRVYAKTSSDFFYSNVPWPEVTSVPDSTLADWKEQYIDLSSFAGNQKIQVKFTYIAGKSNNTFIRNIYLGPHAMIGENDAESLRLYPNPIAGEEVTIAMPERFRMERLEVYTPTGIRMAQQVFTGEVNRTTISTSGWMPGVYLIRVSTNHGVVTRKLAVL